MRFSTLYGVVQKYGLKTPTRAGEAKQYLDQTLEAEVGIFPCRPGGNAAIGFVEGLQMIAGTAELAPMKAYAPHAKHELFGLNSYYGPRIASQVPRVITELLQHPTSRRAILYVGTGADSPDTAPCTAVIQFQAEYPGSVYLHTTVYMRSSDMVYGLPYDVIQFSMLAHAVAECCDMKARGVTVHTGNAHIYTETAVAADVWDEGEFKMPDNGAVWNNWVEWAKDIVYSEPVTRSQFLDIFKVKVPRKGGDATKHPG